MNPSKPSFPATEPDGNGHNYPRILAIITLFMFTSLTVAAILVPGTTKHLKPNPLASLKAGSPQALVVAEEEKNPSYTKAVIATVDYNAQYRTVFVKDGVDLATAVAQAQANGADVVSQMSALGAYTVTAGTVDKTKALSSTLVSDTQMPFPATTGVLQPPGGGSGNTVPTYNNLPSVSSSFTVGAAVSINHASWNANGSPITSYRYTWYRCSNTSAGSCGTSGNYGQSYILGSNDAGKYIAAAEAACNSYGCGAYDESGVYGPVGTPAPSGGPTPPGGSNGNPCSSSNTEKISVGLVRINARLSKTVSGDCQGSIPTGVAVIDSGVNKVADLNVVSQQDFIGATTANGCKPTGGTGVGDDLGHGTAVAGVIAGEDNNIGIVGTAPGAPIYSLRVVDPTDVAYTTAMICAINAVAMNPSIAVVNMSIWGVGNSAYGTSTCTSGTDTLHIAICKAEAATGVVFVVIAGNNGGQYFDNMFPATYPEVLTVAAMNDYNGSPGGGANAQCSVNGGADDALANYSNIPSAADASHTVVAPGSCIYTTNSDGSYGYWTGTSLAAPMVTGLVADCKYFGECPGNPAQVISKVYNDARNFNNANPKYSYTGVNAGPLIDLGLY